MKIKLSHYLILNFVLIVILSGIMPSCKKEQSYNNVQDNYLSIVDFHSQNEVPLKHYSINAATGGSFTTQQGTIVRIPANAFVDNVGNLVTGIVDVEFRDIYTKADMLLSDKPTITIWGTPLKSAGEFFIRATSANTAVNLNNSNPIVVVQPTADKIDSMMQPFIGVNNPPIANGLVWVNDTATNSILKDSINSYIFNLYKFSSPLSSGTWCNSDNSSYFANYPQTKLTLRANDNVDSFHTEVFLVFKNINCMIHVYRDNSSSTYQDFAYYYAPVGLSCTLIAVGVKNKILYSSFVPITISNNQIVNFNLQSTTTADFIAQLKSLN